jgi:DNA-binding HxlR family transcriptional regulator
MLEKICPIEATARILGSRWTLQIIHNLREPRRYCELQEQVGDVNPTTFSQRLRFLEQEGLVQRLPISLAPRHVIYELTEMGKELLPVLDDISNWATRWLPLEIGENPANSPHRSD